MKDKAKKVLEKVINMLAILLITILIMMFLIVASSAFAQVVFEVINSLSSPM